MKTISGRELRDRMLKQLDIARKTGVKPPPDPVIEKFRKPFNYDNSKISKEK